MACRWDLATSSSSFLESMWTATLYLSGLPQLDLSEHLVGEGGGHDEAGMAHSATKVNKTTLSQQDEVLAVREGVPVHLGLDVCLLLAVLLQPLDLDLAVEVTNVADDRVVLHHHEVLAGQDVLATSGGDKDVAPPC